MSILQNIILPLLCIYLLLIAFMYFAQRSFLYFPDQTPVRAADISALETITVQTKDGLALTGWLAKPRNNGKPTIVLFHGNAGNISHRQYKAAPFIEAGYGVLLAEYRGYGGNPGTPTEDGLYADARAYLRAVSGPVVLWGESLGSGIAVQMATEFPVTALILESPFTSAVDVGKAAYPFLPVSLLMKDRYDSLSKVENISVPVLIVHGTADRVIPVALGTRLYEAVAEPKRIEYVAGAGHNDLMDFGLVEKMLSFLQTYHPAKE